MEVASLVSAMVPIGAYMLRSCITRVRNPLSIRKSLILIPPKSGKSYLKKILGYQKDLIIIDLDELVGSKANAEELKNLIKFGDNVSTIEDFNFVYFGLAKKIYDETKEKLKASKKLRCIFLSSCFELSQLFKKDSTFILSPDSKYFDELLKDLSPEEDKLARTKRQNLLDKIEDKRTITLYSSLSQLENLVRVHFKINYIL